MITLLKAFLFTSLFFFQTTALAAVSFEQEIDKIVQYYHTKEAFHGNIEVRLKGQILYKKNIGIANEAFDIPNDVRSRFMIASISKQFTAAAILIMAEKGLIDLDAKYSRYVPLKEAHPETQARWDSFTIRDLLTHKAGITRDIRPTGNYNPETYAPLLAAIVDDMTQSQNIFLNKKSSEGQYSNFGYMLLAYLVQVVTHNDFHNYLTQHIFAPLGMKSTGQYHRMFNIKYMAEGYNYIDGLGELRRRCCYDATSFVGSHGLYSDVTDLMIWLEDLTARQSKILSPESVKLLTSVQSSMGHQDANYGFGFFIDEILGQKRIWHDGVESGYLSLVSMVPEADIKIVILGNRHTSLVSDGRTYTREMNDEIIQLLLTIQFAQED